ncbi:uncharacterized protein MONBRDRAFT_10003 [Monosiga brevicollis MX1]|uniref:UDP-glucuronic acid decarboxylase 1 n=1 Tax=Monosiga brevicollis TaxID=81824 RepID=A9V4W9_MONBE|nr:uncharacterized protein MONBRDRAFT_10003 [Monosiga brevicollis MX1]EDQ87528.1 predicted protein [Monosiga brevicollis MX1]|eukprot:XP_001747788.1 hypothetical protein [Monosiga brevicollis MX1]
MAMYQSTNRLAGLAIATLLLVVVYSAYSNPIDRDTAEQKDSVVDRERQVEQRQRELSDLRRELSLLKNASNTRAYPEVKIRNEFDRKRILITGGAGFVGSHLVDVLMRDGHEVTVVDNFFTGRRKNVEHWIGHPHFELVMHDVVEPYMMECDEIYHLASPASPPHYMYNPVKTIKTNTVGTMNMLGLAKRTGARVLLASTSEVYGNPTVCLKAMQSIAFAITVPLRRRCPYVHPQPETYFGNVNPDGPRACYDEGKRIAETMCYAYSKQSGVEVRVARIFNTFGPRMHIGDGRVVSNFIIQALQDQAITVYGEGLQTRSFQYVSDLVAGLIALMNSDFDEPVNLGNPDEYTMIDFAKHIKEITGSSSEIIHKPATQDDPQKRKPDISRARQVLKWEPKVSVLDGLKRTIEYFRHELSAPTTRDENKHSHGVGGPYGNTIELPYINDEKKP